MIVASMVVPGVSRTLGKKRAYIVGGFIGVVGGAAMAFAPGSIPAIGIACYGVLNFGIGLVNTLIFAIQPDTVDYGEWKTGVRGEGGSYSVLSFTRKAGQGVGGRRGLVHPRARGLRLRRGDPDRRGADLDQGGRRPHPRRRHPDRGAGHVRLPADRGRLPPDRPGDGRPAGGPGGYMTRPVSE